MEALKKRPCNTCKVPMSPSIIGFRKYMWLCLECTSTEDMAPEEELLARAIKNGN